jgi:hypothetical protein
MKCQQTKRSRSRLRAACFPCPAPAAPPFSGHVRSRQWPSCSCGSPVPGIRGQRTGGSASGRVTHYEGGEDGFVNANITGGKLSFNRSPPSARAKGSIPGRRSVRACRRTILPAPEAACSPRAVWPDLCPGTAAMPPPARISASAATTWRVRTVDDGRLLRIAIGGGGGRVPSRRVCDAAGPLPRQALRSFLATLATPPPNCGPKLRGRGGRGVRVRRAGSNSPLSVRNERGGAGGEGPSGRPPETSASA